jgi:hypothetical protein
MKEEGLKGGGLMKAKLAIAIATAGVTLGAAAAPAMAGTVRQDKTTITIGVVHKADGTWFTGKVSTPRARNGEAGRSVALFARGSVVGNGDITGSTRGHSAGYWQIRVSRFAGISSTRFSAFVFDKIYPGLTNPQIDELPAQSVSILYSNGAVVGPGNAVSMNKKQGRNLDPAGPQQARRLLVYGQGHERRQRST